MNMLKKLLWALFAIVSIIIFILGIIFIFGIDPYAHDDVCNCFEYVSAKGIVTDTFISERKYFDNETGIEHIIYAPNIIYEYQINGITYTGNNNPRYLTNNTENIKIEKYLEKYYKIGKNINIQYDKNDHKESYMVEFDILYAYLFSTGLIIIGLAGLIFIIYNNRKNIALLPAQTVVYPER